MLAIKMSITIPDSMQWMPWWHICNHHLLHIPHEASIKPWNNSHLSHPPFQPTKAGRCAVRLCRYASHGGGKWDIGCRPREPRKGPPRTPPAPRLTGSNVPTGDVRGSSHEKSRIYPIKDSTKVAFRLLGGHWRILGSNFFPYVRRIGSSQDGSTDTVGFHVSMEVSLERPRTGSGGKGPFPDGLFIMAWGGPS